jgi:hypothetical protein
MRRSLPAIVLLSLSVALVGCKQTGVRVQPDQVIGEEQFNVVQPNAGDVRDDTLGKEVWFAYGAMSGINKTNANGVATGHFFDSTMYVLGIQLNIQPAVKGSFYEAWLTDEEGIQMQSAGHLTNPFGDVRHQLRFDMKKDLRPLKHIVVTLEKDDGNPSPSDQRVAEGTIKEQKR